MATLSRDHKIFVAGHRGLIGSALVRNLKDCGYTNVITRGREELDLLDSNAVYQFLESNKPDAIILSAAMVGGIYANNTYRSEFIFNNLQIQNNVIWNAHKLDIDRLIFLGSSCIYPRNAPQPMPEEALLTGMLEFTNRPYALAKISGLELTNSIRLQYGRNYFSVMPTNLYGPGDNFHKKNSHVLPALIRRFIEAREQKSPEVVVWGSGTPKREFMYVDDCANAIIFLMENFSEEKIKGTAIEKYGWSHVNLGSGDEVTILELANIIAESVGYEGRIVFDSSKPDGPPRKLVDITVLKNIGWKPKIHLREGVERTVSWFMEKQKDDPSSLRL